MGDLQSILTAAGLRFAQPDGSYDLANLSGKKCFSHYIREPNVSSLAELEKRAKALSPVATRPMAFADGKGGWVQTEQSVALVDERDGRHISTVSPEYQLIQDRDLVLLAAEAIRDLGLTPVGTVHQASDRLHVCLVMADKDYVIPLLKDHSRTIMSGFSFTNSYNTSLGIHPEAAGIDTVCTNYNLWGSVIAADSMTHLEGDEDSLTARVRAVLEASLKAAPRVQALAEASQEIRLLPTQVSPLLAGIGFSEPQVEQIDGLRGKLEPLSKKNLTALSLNFAATAYVTHVANTNPASLRELSRKAMRLLDGEKALGAAEVKGRELLKAWAVERKAAEEKKAAKVAAKTSS